MATGGVVGLNEAGGDSGLIERLATTQGYTAVGTKGSQRVRRNNPILVPPSLTVTEWENRIISDPDPGGNWRSTTCAVLHGVAAVFNTHWNHAVQEGRANPHEKPRVAEWIRGADETIAWMVEVEQRTGLPVILLGDLNWSWTPQERQWEHAPRELFEAQGWTSQHAHRTRLDRPAGDRRAIEYVVYDPGEWDLTRQWFVTPEKSDHPFHAVELERL